MRKSPRFSSLGRSQPHLHRISTFAIIFNWRAENFQKTHVSVATPELSDGTSPSVAPSSFHTEIGLVSLCPHHLAFNGRERYRAVLSSSLGTCEAFYRQTAIFLACFCSDGLPRRRDASAVLQETRMFTSGQGRCIGTHWAPVFAL